MIAEIRAENDRIPDSALSDKLEKLENLCAEVFRAVYDKPAKAPQIRKFMDYYLPTTLKMVKGLRTLDERGVTGAQAQDAAPGVSPMRWTWSSMAASACWKISTATTSST